MLFHLGLLLTVILIHEVGVLSTSVYDIATIVSGATEVLRLDDRWSVTSASHCLLELPYILSFLFFDLISDLSIYDSDRITILP